MTAKKCTKSMMHVLLFCLIYTYCFFDVLVTVRVPSPLLLLKRLITERTKPFWRIADVNTIPDRLQIAFRADPKSYPLYRKHFSGRSSRRFAPLKKSRQNYSFYVWTEVLPAVLFGMFFAQAQELSGISIGNSMICSDIWHKYHEWYFKIVIRNFSSR